MNALNDYQKAIIYILFSQDNFTYPLPLHDGAILALEQQVMIGKATNQYMVRDLNNALFPYLLQPWVIDELNDKPDMVVEFEVAFQKKNNEIY